MSKELHRKTQQLFEELFFKGINNPSSSRRLGFYRLLTTDRKFKDLVESSAARTLGPPDERLMGVFNSYFDNRIDVDGTYTQIDLNEGLVKFLVNNLELNPEQTELLWEIIYYNLRVFEERKRKMEEEDKKRMAILGYRAFMPLPIRAPPTLGEDEMPDYVRPIRAPRDRTNPPPFPPPFPPPDSGGRRRKSRKPKKSSNKKRKQKKTKRRRQ
jgi:hypothetical protein